MERSDAIKRLKSLERNNEPKEFTLIVKELSDLSSKFIQYKVRLGLSTGNLPLTNPFQFSCTFSAIIGVLNRFAEEPKIDGFFDPTAEKKRSMRRYHITHCTPCLNVILNCLSGSSKMLWTICGAGLNIMSLDTPPILLKLQSNQSPRAQNWSPRALTWILQFF